MTGPVGARRLPAGLLGMLALTAALECFLFRAGGQFASDHAASWRFADRQGGRKARGHEVLCLGDSLVKFGILPSVLTERTGKSAYNLALFSGPTPATYFLLRRALAEGARPSALVFDCTAGILTEGPESQKRAYPWPELLRTSEAFDLAWTSRDPELFARIALAQVLHSFKDRFEIRDGVRDALAGKRNHGALLLAINHRNWNRNGGAQAQARKAFDDYPFPSGPKPPPRWKCHPVNGVYLRRTLELAAASKIAVYWLIPPFSPGAQAHHEHDGSDARYDELVSALRRRFSNIVVIDARHSGFPKTAFFDTAHLDCEGAAALSAGVADVLTRAGDVSGRWIPLPPPRPTPARLEDTAQSILAVKENARRVRR